MTTGALYSTLLHALPQEARRTPQAGAAASIGKRNGHLPLPAALAREAVRPAVRRAPGAARARASKGGGTARAGGCRPVRCERAGGGGDAVWPTTTSALRCDVMTCLRAVLYGSRASRCVVAWRLFKRWGAPAPDGGPQAAGVARMTHWTREWQLLPGAEREDHVLAFARYVL